MEAGLGLPAYAVYKDKKPGDKVKEDDDLKTPEVLMKRKRRSLQEIDLRKKKKKKLSPRKSLSLDILKQAGTGTEEDDTVKSTPPKPKKAIKKNRDSASAIESSSVSNDGDDTNGTSNADKSSFIQLFNPLQYEDCRASARALFELIIQPCSVDTFFSDIWENEPILFRRHNPLYNDGWFSSKELHNILQQNSLQYSVNINITSYEEGQRLTHNPIGRVYASTVWEFYEKGCSIQLLNPQTYSKKMWMLGATLQELFGSFVGANVYLTPPGTQGFAPHYDDIEAFVMQIEGKKRWKLYKPSTRHEILPRVSSKNFKQSELGEQILDVILEPGDLLYFPRGTVHQASSLPNTHSLHITMSTYQKNTWGDYLEKLIPAALKTAIEEDEDYRKGLPIDYRNYMGSIHSNKKDPLRTQFMDRMCGLMSRIVQYASFDLAADQMGLDFIHGSLPPFISENEKGIGVWKDLGNPFTTNYKGIEITLDSRIRLIRRSTIRVVDDEESDMAVLYYNTNNTRVYHEKEPEGMEVAPKDVAILSFLVDSYPNYVKVDDLPSVEDDETKVDVVYMLYNLAVIVVEDEEIQ